MTRPKAKWAESFFIVIAFTGWKDIKGIWIAVLELFSIGENHPKACVFAAVIQKEVTKMGGRTRLKDKQS